MNWKKLTLITFSLIVGIIALYIIFVTIDFNEVAGFFKNATWWTVGGFILASIGVQLSMAWRWSVVLKAQKHKVPYMNTVWYRLIGYSISYLTPSAKIGGEPVRAALLKRNGLEFKEGLSSVVIDKTLELAAGGILFFIGVLTVFLTLPLPEQTVTYLFLFSGFFVLASVLFYSQMLRGKHYFLHVARFLRFKDSWLKKVEDFEKVMIKFYDSNKKAFLVSVGISLLAWFFTFAEYGFALLILGYSANALQLFLVFAFVGAAYLIPIPMAVGSLEASQISIFAIMKLKSALGVALALLIRARELLWTAIGLIALSVFGLRISEIFESSLKRVDEEIEEMED